MVQTSASRRRATTRRRSSTRTSRHSLTDYYPAAPVVSDGHRVGRPRARTAPATSWSACPSTSTGRCCSDTRPSPGSPATRRRRSRSTSTARADVPGRPDDRLVHHRRRRAISTATPTEPNNTHVYGTSWTNQIFVTARGNRNFEKGNQERKTMRQCVQACIQTRVHVDRADDRRRDRRHPGGSRHLRRPQVPGERQDGRGAQLARADGQGPVDGVREGVDGGRDLAPAHGRHLALALCLDADAPPFPQPRRPSPGQKYQSSQAAGADWNQDRRPRWSGFACLKFAMDAPQYYMYSFTTTNRDRGGRHLGRERQRRPERRRHPLDLHAQRRHPADDDVLARPEPHRAQSRGVIPRLKTGLSNAGSFGARRSSFVRRPG